MPIPMTMTVPVFRGDGEIDWEDRPVPEPGRGQLLVAVGANAICGSDRLQHRFGSPVTPGHEAAGVVVATGAGTTTPPGTAGVIYLMAYCGTCRSCRLAHTNQCAHKTADMGFTHDGGYAPYELIDERIFFATGDDIPPVEATMLLDVMGTSAHAIDRARTMRPDVENVIVAGAGPIGLGLIAMAKIVLGSDIPVFVTDQAPYRLRLAETLGAIPIDIRTDTFTDALTGHGISGGADLAFDAAGRTEARRGLLDHLGSRGVLVCIGHGHGLELRVSNDLIAPERAILGSEYFRFDELEVNLERLRHHRELLDQVITHRFAVADLDEAFAIFLAGETGKVVIEP